MFEMNKMKFWLFIVIILIFIFGGYYLMDYTLSTDVKKNQEETKQLFTTTSDYRLDKTKEYIYFTDIDYPIEGEDMNYQTININLKNLEYLQDRLNKEEDEYDKTVVFLKDTETNETSEEIDMTFSNSEGIYGFSYRSYDVIMYDEYISIVYKDYTYDIENLNIPVGYGSYVINKNETKEVYEDEILKMYEFTLDEIKEIVLEKVNASAYQDSSINVSKTVDDFDYMLYINNIGSLEVTYLISSTKGEYYDKIVLN